MKHHIVKTADSAHTGMLPKTADSAHTGILPNDQSCLLITNYESQ